ncbi:MAG: MlaD family protein [Actinobacteria bacterium]|nr:MlaD family protein [Actinomycetota bacterium]
MTSNVNRWKLGLFVISGVLLGFGSLFWVGASRFDRESYQVVTFFDESVQGLNPGSEVKFRGVKVGTVSDISIAPNRRHVKVTVELYRDALARLGIEGKGDDVFGLKDHAWVETGLRFQLASSGITGDKFLLVDYFKSDKDEALIGVDPPPNYLPSVPSTLKSLEESLGYIMDQLPQMTAQVRGILERADSLVGHVDQLVVEIEQRQIVARTSKLMDDVDAQLLAADIPGLSERTKKLLDESSAAIAEMRQTVQRLDAPEGPVRALIARIDATLATADAAIKDAKVGETTSSMRGATESVTEIAIQMSRLSEALQADLVALREALEAIRALADLLERDPGALLRGRAPAGERGGNP